MTSSKVSLSIGIPAYNEEQNIKKLLLTLLSQRMSLVELVEILVVDDLSSDRTAEEVRSVSDPRIRLIEQGQRRGLAAGQNLIAQKASGDILVLLDGDVLPRDENFLDALCKPIIEDASVGLVGADVIAAPGLHTIENILVTSHELKMTIYRQINGGNTIYLCHGRARAFSRALYSTIHWPDKFAEDQYSYLYARAKNFGFAYAPTATIIFRSPSTMGDHFRQSLRFINGHKTIIKEFDIRKASDEYAIPFKAVISSVSTYLMKKPLHTVSYIFILAITRFLSRFIKLKNQSSYQPSISSKKI